MSIKNFLFKFPDIFKKKSLDALTNTTTEFPQLDIEQLCKEWRLAEIGEDDGKKNIPSSSTASYGSKEQQITASFSGILTERKNQSISYIQDLERQFSNMKLSEMVSQLNTFARSAKNAFGKIIQQADDALHSSKASFESLTKKYGKFKQINKLEYEPHYPPSRVFLFSILFIEVLIETFFNFSFFKEVSEDYIIGGVFTAFFLSIVNVGFLGWFFGKNCFWYKNHVNQTKRSLGWSSGALFLILALLLNFFVANYRVVATLATKNETNFNFNEVLNNMFSFNYSLSLNDWFLFLIGFVAAIIAFVTSYNMDDAYPGYGKIHRQLEESREEYNNTKAEIEEELDQIQKDQIREVSKLSDDLTVNHNMSKSIIADEESYLSKLKNSHEYLEQACNVCLREYQENNESARTKPKPKYFNKTFQFGDNFTLENNVKNNKEILKKTSVYVDQIGSHLTKAKSEITNNYEAARDRFRVIEQKNKLI
jgi:hypothetical protein|tara:strand:- start:397 stop:1839 length:1443 start_codon:yes stop_codon:yes gene_type:complete